MRVFKSLMLTLAVGLTACSDPASEQPVSIKPGLYQLTMDRTALGPAKISHNAKDVEKHCVASESDLEWIYPMIERKFCADCDCSTKDKTRTGNAIGGHAVCPFDDQGMFGALEYTYQGIVSEDGVTVEGQVKSGLSSFVAPGASEADKKKAAEIAANVESVVVSGRFERLGDCTA